MPRTARRLSLYEQLQALPEGLTGEILLGQLYTQARPSGRHGLAAAVLTGDLVPSYSRGRGGPGGWWIIPEPEVHFVRDEEVVVPDLAGWRRERLPTLPEDHRFEVVPDWVCEILSPSTASKDREIKLPLYAHYGVPYCWLVDPKRRTLVVHGLDGGAWHVLLEASGAVTVQSPPFGEIALELAALWV